jgi:hypothetical protein
MWCPTTPLNAQAAGFNHDNEAIVLQFMEQASNVALIYAKLLRGITKRYENMILELRVVVPLKQDK